MTATAPRRLATPSSVNAAIKNYAGALQYVPELSWILFLRILDEREEIEAEEAAALGIRFAPSLVAPFRWRDWAAPGGAKRVELTDAAMGAYVAFVNGALLPHLRGLRDAPGASARQRVISQVVSAIDKVSWTRSRRAATRSTRRLRGCGHCSR
jgi:type I restriction enzyme M protein